MRNDCLLWPTFVLVKTLLGTLTNNALDGQRGVILSTSELPIFCSSQKYVDPRNGCLTDSLNKAVAVGITSKVCLKVGAQCIDAMFNFFGQGPVMRVAAVLLYRGELNPDKGE